MQHRDLPVGERVTLRVHNWQELDAGLFPEIWYLGWLSGKHSSLLDNGHWSTSPTPLKHAHQLLIPINTPPTFPPLHASRSISSLHSSGLDEAENRSRPCTLPLFHRPEFYTPTIAPRCDGFNVYRSVPQGIRGFNAYNLQSRNRANRK